MKYFTSDLHLHHPFVAALRGYAKPEYAHLAAADLREYARTNRWKLADMVDWQRHDRDVNAALNLRDATEYHTIE